jgi:transcriptional regulator with XRE-family HTH domain
MTLREYRQRAGLTLQQVAILLGVHFTTVQKWEIGERIPDAIAVAAIESLTRGKVRAATFKRGAESKDQPGPYRRRRPREAAARKCTQGKGRKEQERANA